MSVETAYGVVTLSCFSEASGSLQVTLFEQKFGHIDEKIHGAISLSRSITTLNSHTVRGLQSDFLQH